MVLVREGRKFSYSSMRVDLDLNRIRVLADSRFEDGRRQLSELFDAYAADTRERVSESRAALASGDLACVRALAHAQKGASAMVGARVLAECFAAVECRWQDPDAVAAALDAVEPALASLDGAVRALVGNAIRP